MRSLSRLLFISVVIGLGGCWATQAHDQPDRGYADSDLPLFAPARHGMAWTSRTYDMAGKGVGNELEEVDRLDNAGEPKTRHLRVVEDVQNGASQFSNVTLSLYPDRLESVTDETGRTKVLLHTPLTPGTTWTYKRGANDMGVERRTITAIEDVCTTWGYFPRAIKVVGTILGPRPGTEEALRTRTEEWWAPGVGRVQVIAHVDGKPELDIKSVLEAFNDTEGGEVYTPKPCPS